MKPQNFEERLIWYLLISTYGLYILGILYLANSVLAWVLFFYLCKQLWDQTGNTPAEKRINIPWASWVWVVAMLVMIIVTVVGCLDFNVEWKEIIKALLRWCTEWSLIALFILSGCLNIRPRLIYRAICIVCLQSLIFIPICYAGYILNLPSLLYSSPVSKFMPGSSIYYNVFLYGLESFTYELRLFLFAPWGPALGITSIIYFFLALQEPDKKWRWIGLVGAIAMCLVSVSRQAILSLPLLIIIIWALTNFTRPATQIMIGLSGFLSGLFGAVILNAAEDTWDAFNDFRPGSSRFHDLLSQIAFQRWEEAPIWGHGIQAPGPKIVSGLPVGSNHTWFGLLYVKGLVGFIAFALPLLSSFVDLLIKAQESATAKVGLSVVLTIFLFSFNDNQEVLFYLYWPGLVIMGIAHRQDAKSAKVEKERILQIV